MSRTGILYYEKSFQVIDKISSEFQTKYVHILLIRTKLNTFNAVE